MRGLNRSSAITAAILVSLGFISRPALPQDAATTSDLVGVMEKPRPAYDAQGIPIGGGWLLFPALSETGNYDDNIYRVQGRRDPDWYVETTPIARVQRKWSDGSVGLYGTLDNFAYARFQQLDLTDWSFGGDGAITLGKSLTATVSGGYGEAHEDFSSAEILGRFGNLIGKQYNQTRYFMGHSESVIEYKASPFDLSAGASLVRYDWRPTSAIVRDHLVLYDNADRDETMVEPYIRASYEMLPGYSIFARAQYDDRLFDRSERSSSGYHVDGGLSWLSGKTLTGEAFLGYFRQAFQAPLPSFGALDYGATLGWFPQPDLTFHLSASRSATDLPLPRVSVSDDQSFRISADYEARPDVIVQALAGYTTSRIITSERADARTDHYPSAGLTLRYLINRYASAQIGYLYTSRHSVPNQFQLDFRDQTFTAGFVLHI